MNRAAVASGAVVVLGLALLPRYGCNNDAEPSKAKGTRSHEQPLSEQGPSAFSRQLEQQVNDGKNLEELTMPAVAIISPDGRGGEVSPARVVLYAAEQLQDPELLLFILRALDPEIIREKFSDEERSLIHKQAIRIDPYQEYMRSMKLSSPPELVDLLLSQNGEKILKGEIDQSPIEVSVDSAQTPSEIVLSLDGEILTAPMVGRSEQGGVLFKLQDPSLQGELLVALHASSRGMVLDFTWPGRPPMRVRVWEGTEVIEEPPPSFMEEIERLLYP